MPHHADARADASHEPFRLALTRNLFAADGSPAFDFGLDVLDATPDIRWDRLPDDVEELPAGALDGYDGVVVHYPTRVTRESLRGADRLRLVARPGVGYDNVDVDACSERGVLVTITPDAVRRPMATAAVTLVLALSQHLVQRDRVTRAGRWEDRARYLGVGLRERTVGLVGFGNIGRETAALLRPFDTRLLVADPVVDGPTAAAHGASLVELETLLAESDFVVVVCALTPATRHLLDGARLRLLKPSAFLVNVARGAIVDQAALTEALTAGALAGAGLDVFEQEPLAPDDPLLALDNVVTTAHSLGWTDQCLRDCGVSAIESALAVAAGRRPAHVVNPDALATVAGSVRS